MNKKRRRARLPLQTTVIEAPLSLVILLAIAFLALAFILGLVCLTHLFLEPIQITLPGVAV